jgi:hypothetical protein
VVDGGGGGGRGGDIFKLIAIVVGLAMTYYHIYGYVRDKVRQVVQLGTNIILDIEGDRPGGVMGDQQRGAPDMPQQAAGTTAQEIPEVD